jgi:hypothetical protein
VVTGGQYAEAKRILIGLFLLGAAGLAAAISWAAYFLAAWHDRVVPRLTIETECFPW